MSDETDVPWTEGPWEARTTSNRALARISTDKGDMHIKAKGLPKRGEMNANARLIAAAPRSVEELEECRDLLKRTRRAIIASGIVSTLTSEMKERIEAIDTLLTEIRGDHG